MTPYFTTAGLPAYQPGMLIVKMRSAAIAAPPVVVAPAVAVPARKAAKKAARLIAQAAARSALVAPTAFVLPGTASFSAVNSPGMSVLAQMERGGRIRRSILLSRYQTMAAMPPGAMRAMSTMMAAVALPPVAYSPSGRPDPHNGVTMLELEPGANVDELRDALAADPSVERVDKVPARYLTMAKKATKKVVKPNAVVPAAVPPPASTLWNLSKIQWAAARALPNFQDANGIKVGVLDTGIEQDHPDLAGRVRGYTYQYSDAVAPSENKDYVGHGTHVAGTIAASNGNGLGINGICDCDLRAWKIFSDQTYYHSGLGYFTYLVDSVMYQQALADCLEQEMDVINLSIGGPGKPDHAEQELFDLLRERGTKVVAAMGNERQVGSPTSYPAAIPGVIAVGATTLQDTVANFSNRGPHIAISAPGVAVWSTLPSYPGQSGFRAAPGPGGTPVPGQPYKRETDYDAWPGTSMASPHVAAAVALLLANKGSDLSPADVLARLASRADKVPAMNGKEHHEDFGAGRLNLLKLLQ